MNVLLQTIYVLVKGVSDYMQKKENADLLM